MSDDLRAAVAAGVLGSEEQFRALLQSIVDVARVAASLERAREEEEDGSRETALRLLAELEKLL
jgi:hypothetical protein